jgi:Putative abortive phage resistance protein AbiGi, antitoxin
MALKLPKPVAKLLGGLLPPSAYVSSELTHFAGRGQTEEQQYNTLLSILKGGHLRGPGFQQHVHHMNPYASVCANQMYVPSVVCFCDIPSGSLEIHMNKYSRFGLSFEKAFLVGRGANPVFYVVKESVVPPNAWPQSVPVARPPQVQDPYNHVVAQPPVISRCDYFDVMVRILHSALTIEMAVMANQGQQALNAYVRLMDLNSFISLQVMAFVKFFDSSLAADHPDNYYMEREWRTLGDLQFALTDVVRVIVPKPYKARLMRDLPLLDAAVLTV